MDNLMLALIIAPIMGFISFTVGLFFNMFVQCVIRRKTVQEYFTELDKYDGNELFTSLVVFIFFGILIYRIFLV